MKLHPQDPVPVRSDLRSSQWTSLTLVDLSHGAPPAAPSSAAPAEEEFIFAVGDTKVPN